MGQSLFHDRARQKEGRIVEGYLQPDHVPKVFSCTNCKLHESALQKNGKLTRCLRHLCGA